MHTVPVGRTNDAVGGRHRSRLTHGAATQRDRLIAAMGELVAELGQTTIGVHHVCQRAGISRRTFYDLYADRDACLVETLEAAYGQLLAHVTDAVADAGDEWEDRTVAATQALLVAFEADRVLAHLCLMPAAGGHSGALALRRTAIGRLAALLADAPAPALPSSRCSPARWAASGTWRSAA